ncbi:hypothetical protein [Actinophytocola sediminis]
MLDVVAFGVAWWLGLYLIARDPTKPTLRRAGAGLLSYALAIVVDGLGEHGPALAAAHAVLLSLPAVLWTGVLIRLSLTEDEPAMVDRWWWRGLVPVTVVLAAVAGMTGGVALVVLAVTVLAPLCWRLVHLVRRRAAGTLLVAVLLVGLAAGLLTLGLGVLPRPWLLTAIGVDLVALGLVVAVSDSFDEGQTLRRDMLHSLLLAGGTAALFGGQVGVAMLLTGAWLAPLCHGVVAAAIAVQVLARPIQRATDRLALPAGMRAARAELREVADAIPRRDETVALAELSDAEFTRLTRRALSHYGDLGKLVSSPLTALTAIDERRVARGAPDTPLARATELKALLLDTITRLKPRDGEFGTSEEWRHYNALFFYYVVGVRPYSVRTKLTDLDPVARRALSWFADQVPERTLHNWQAAAAKVVAADLRAGLPADLR